MTYVFHCDKCKRMVLKENRDQAECPPEISGPIEYSGQKMQEMNPYSKQFDGGMFYPNVGQYFETHKDYERHLKATGREIMTDGHDSHDRGDEGYCGHVLKSNEGRTCFKKRSRTLYFT